MASIGPGLDSPDGTDCAWLQSTGSDASIGPGLDSPDGIQFSDQIRERWPASIGPGLDSPDGGLCSEPPVLQKIGFNWAGLG